MKLQAVMLNSENPDKLVDEKFLLLPPTEVDYAFPP